MLEQISQNGKILVFSIAKPEEVDEMTGFAEEHYFTSSPLRELFSLDDGTYEERLAYRRDCFQKCFQHPTSILVREKSTGHLVAFYAAVVRERSEASAETSVDPDDRSPGWLVRYITAELLGLEDLYALYQTDRILQIWRGGVRKDYRGQRLLGMSSTTCRALLAKIAQENKIGAMRMEAFSSYAAPEKCWQLIRTIHFEKLQLPDGNRPFANVDFGVHSTGRLLVCRPPPLILFHQQSDAAIISFPKSKM